jgi:tetratricopeptide (TPR) repeat protein
MRKKTVLLIALYFVVQVSLLRAQAARAWEEALVIPTYLVEPPEPNPIFFSGRAYQGAKGPVYPYPFLDRLTDKRVDRSYRAVYLENKYVKICVLPEIGGRLFSAVDKSNGYDFIYRQHVIKPALIGMLGAWISGGVEWNIPHHHRATTFMEVDHAIVQDRDGSATVWVGEIDLRHRMKWSVGLTLRPDTSVIEVTMKVFNRTPLAQAMLAWANVAVHANPEYQVFFPPDVEFATFHGKNQFSRWPLSAEVFNRQDYTKGVDVSWWKSHAAPTSFFAWEAQGDFLAGYDHGQDAGVAFVADHAFVPGKKLWTWGTGNEGRLWERILTESDGPYAELMIGAFSDNQPDYSWIQPYETRTVKQSWYPFRKLGGVKAANENGACNLTVDDQRRARIALQMTRDFGEVRLRLKAGDRVCFEALVPARPEEITFKDVPLPAGVEEESLRLEITTVDMGHELLTYASSKREKRPLPPVVTSPSAPKDIATIEDLYLTGLRLEQFNNPALEPGPYYEEALKRDPGDYRTNTALGLLYLKRAMYRDAEEKLRRAVERATKNYTRPKDGEALYYLGLALRAQGKSEEAEDLFGRAAWTQAWRSASFHQIAELACSRGDFGKALALAEASLETNSLNNKALDLKAALLRRMNRLAEAQETVSRALVLDRMDFWARNELYLLKNTGGLQEDVGRVHQDLMRLMRDAEPNFLELAADYGACGLWDEALGVLDRLGNLAKKDAKAFPLLHYFLAYYWDRKGDAMKATEAVLRAASQPPEYGFPFQSESLDVLRWAQVRNPKDGRAPFYLGNYLFDLQPESAMAEWEKAASLDGTNSVGLRNLGLAYARVKNDISRAIDLYRRALAGNPGDPRLYVELDQLEEAARAPLAGRLERLEKNQGVVEQRDDALTREILLLVRLGRYDRAIELLSRHHFHVWEGGGEIHGVFVDAHLLRGQKYLNAGDARAALKDFQTALTYPANLEVGEPSSGGGSAKVYFLIGVAQDALGDKDLARAAHERATAFRHGWSEQSFYQALANRKRGREAEAVKLLDGLIRFAGERLKSAPAMDFFEKFGEKQSAMAQSAQAHYLLGLGHLGKGKKAEARKEFEKALELNYGLTGAARMLDKNSGTKLLPAAFEESKRPVPIIMPDSAFGK